MRQHPEGHKRPNKRERERKKAENVCRDQMLTWQFVPVNTATPTSPL